MYSDARALAVTGDAAELSFAYSGVPRLVATVSTLLSKGAAPDSRNAAGETPRDVAHAAAAKRTASSNALSIVEKLMKAAAPNQSRRARAADVDRRVVRGPRRAGRGGSSRARRVSGPGR